MKRYSRLCIIIITIFLLLFPMPVSADIGPKPSVVINFTGLEDETYYATLLSRDSFAGPWNCESYYEMDLLSSKPV